MTRQRRTPTGPDEARDDVATDAHAVAGAAGIPEGGVLYDVPFLHDAGSEEASVAAATSGRPFAKGVGLEGYDRRTGVAVPTHPALRVPGESAPRASPFGGGEADEANDEDEADDEEGVADAEDHRSQL